MLEWSLALIMGSIPPPRDPNEDDDGAKAAFRAAMGRPSTARPAEKPATASVRFLLKKQTRNARVEPVC
jgi:hypothetical protein